MKRLLIAGALIGALMLTGCTVGGSPESPSQGSRWNAAVVHLPDGRTVVCVSRSANSGVSCDWESVASR